MTWQDENAYQRSLRRLLRDLRAEDGEPSTPQPAVVDADAQNQARIQSFRQQLQTHYGNLNDLEEESAQYGAISVPTRLRNEIKATRQKVEEIEQELAGLDQFGYGR